MTDQPRPPLWREMDQVQTPAYIEAMLSTGNRKRAVAAAIAAEIAAVATYLKTHGPINTTGKATPRMGAQLLEVFEEEARKAEAISDAKVFQVYDDAYAAETYLAENHCNNEGIEWDEDAVDARANRAGLRAVMARLLEMLEEEAKRAEAGE